MSIEINIIGATPTSIGALVAGLGISASPPQPISARPRPQQQRDYLQMIPLSELRAVRPTTELEHALLAALDEAADLEEKVEELRGAADERDEFKSEVEEQDQKIAQLQSELDAQADTIADLESEVADLRYQLSQQETPK